MNRPRPEVLTRPEQGWSSLLLLVGMLVVLGLSVANSRPLPLPGVGSLTDSLPSVMLGAGLIGYLLARSSLGVVRAHTVGAVVAAFVLLLIAGGALTTEPPWPADLGGIGERITAVWMRLDADISGLLSAEITTSMVTVYLVLGALCWTTAQFGAFSVFRYDRGGPAVMAVGIILFLNLGLGSLQDDTDLLPVVPVLAIFATLALLLLMRMQLVQQRYAWARRHISDAQDVGRLFLRTGVVFVLIAVVGASSLSVWATIEAQEVSIDGLEEPLEGFADEVSRLLEVFGVPSGEDVPQALGTSTALTTNWIQPEGIAFRAYFEEGRLRDNYWWGKADDRYDWKNQRWVTTGARSEDVPAGGQLSSSPGSLAGGQHQADVRIEVGEGSPRANLYRPPDVLSVSRDVTARRLRGGGTDRIAYADVLDEGESVRFMSSTRDYGPDSDTLTANDLRSATGAYPAWVLERYLDGADDGDVIGSKTQALAERLMKEPTAYDQALALQNELRAMDYNPSLGNACDGFKAIPECLLTIKEGFCQQYATTMVMTLRAMGIPARFVTGYLPGDQDENDMWTVEQQALHNWAEVYFPKYGWVRFDPTPGDVGYGGVGTDLIEEDLGPATPRPRETDVPGSPLASEDPPESEEVLPPLGPDDPGDGGTDGVIIIGVAGLVALLLTVVSGLLLFRLRRLPGGDDSLAYRGIVSLATRLGYGPHPSQTEYEFASTLSETIPTVRDDLFVVTAARVATTYGGRQLDDAQRGALRGAYARIRTALLRLSLRVRR